MTDKLKEEELLEWLKYFYAKDVKQKPKHGTATDAYKEIWALIKKPQVTEEWMAEKARELLIKANILINTPEAHQQQLKIIKHFIRKLYDEMPAKKPSVSEGFIKKEATKLISRFSCECKLSYLQQVGIRCVLTEKGDLWDLLTRAGVDIEK